ncbi:hypothetical protein LEP1GSC168_0486 [Leptospira santarosai str. HAI134]|uniref:Uncharacterized protein n=2 Tax=Leptospira santarosai TaxID=28183 RepID=M6V746_9LEPT|nr:hypothetical protein LEP1GSC168_0486 [Leptospira santarosai str. HAI134]EMO45323.1 hypothetical protein LEP1GSC187_0903 [Leptospira santarosai str. ZUN179]EMP81305.1 hypothetical protein LEP1GSC162_2482 [Leptospira santarosai str. CBC1531]
MSKPHLFRRRIKFENEIEFGMRTFTISIELSRGFASFFVRRVLRIPRVFAIATCSGDSKKEYDLKLLRTKLLVPDLEKLQLELSVI